jgi:uncharacterized protein (TIGR00645 family)
VLFVLVDDIIEESKMSLETKLKKISRLLYGARITLLPFYLGLMSVMFGLVLAFVKEVWKFYQLVLTNTSKLNLIIKALELVDMVMVAQLLWVVALAGISLFIADAFSDDNEKQPDWLDHVTTYNLKAKLAYAIISISGVHALKTYLQATNMTIALQTASVHLLFVVSAVGIAFATLLIKMSESTIKK